MPMSHFENLTMPLAIGSGLIVPNRMYFSSVGFDVCDPTGRPLPEFFDIYASIMQGGCGFGFLGNSSVDPDSQYTDRSLKLTSPSHADDLRPVFEAARRLGFPLGVQLQHYGVHAPAPGDGGHAVEGDVTSVGDEQIGQYIDHFGEAARQALSIGAPVLQIHAANGYLLSSFLSPRTNRRTDRWGGSPIGRARILLEIVQRVRALAADRAAIFVRLQIDDGFGEAGLQVEQLGDVVAALEEAGADAITCATGVAGTFGKFLADRDYSLALSRHAVRFLKRTTRLPIGFAANLDSLATAEAIVASGDADFIGFGRAIVADHHFVWKELSGRAAEVDRCRWDSYCLRDKKEPLADRVFCCVNPRYLRPQIIQMKYQEN
ncbi:oxidoreductase [Burkholderia stabilis]|uniref:NADH oxidase,NADPH dehydrogenase NamA,mycofactocin system FadH/OYE family oxidoreductase 2,NADH:flavin oxidoreductase / NADH oxidase family n=1 Tax=Burkholderia stabilis TaxID=95485 RepID=A0AAJ5NK51_9BURK|nr:NADH:flavin oxidoreductase [Burkholderia stabilis]VBB17005.1 NADH oxidase,NADPH dehydrogenase NamA,mycofactocin system FadH/OYE family oxidoreductase 2,NADH:flavin oxidoreductase / NADH oxidase family [Burkholderia stabilis]